MYRQRQPDLLDLPFATLADLVEAVEKYEVFSAMNNCEVSMRFVNFNCTVALIHLIRCSAALDRIVLPAQALAILAYGTRHNDANLMDRAAEHTLSIPPREVFAALLPASFLAWVRLPSPLSILKMRDVFNAGSISSQMAGSVLLRFHAPAALIPS